MKRAKEELKKYHTGGIVSTGSFNHSLFKLNYDCTWIKKPKNDSLPKDVRNVIIHDDTVIVNLTDGRKGIATVSSDDLFDEFTGFCIAYYKAKNTRSFKLKESLKNCCYSADKKGYKNAILKNYD